MELNVDEDYFADETGRRNRLIEIVGCRFRADGMALAAWRLARRFWARDEQLIPEEEWSFQGLEPLIEAKLADRTPFGIYVRGTREKHGWLVQKSDSGRAGGLASAAARREKLGTAVPMGARNLPKNAEVTEQDRTNTERLPNATEADRSRPKPVSLSLSLEDRDNNTPPSPSQGEGGVPKAKTSRAEADAAYDELRDYGSRDRSPERLASLGPLAAAVLGWHFSSPGEFVARYVDAAKNGNLVGFEAELKRTCRRYARGRKGVHNARAGPSGSCPFEGHEVC